MASRPPRARQAWYFIYFSAGGCLNPFLTLLYRAKGMSEAQIGALAALRPLASLPAGYAWSALADHRGWHRRIMLCTLCAATLFKLSQWGLEGVGPLGLVVGLGQCFNAPVTALVDASVVAACDAEEVRRCQPARSRWLLCAPCYSDRPPTRPHRGQ